MKKHWKRRSCLLLCLALLAAFFPSGVSLASGVAMGRYVETVLDLPDGAWQAFAQAGGTVYAVDASGETLLRSLDLAANNWETLPTGHDEGASPAQGGMNGIAVAADGAIYLSSGWAMATEDGYPFLERIQNGEAQRVQLDQKLYTGSDRLLFCALPSGGLIALSDMEAFRFSPDGETLGRYAVPNGTSVAAYGGEAAICSPANGLITVLDVESGQTLRTLPLPSAASDGVVGYDGNGALYYVCADGLYQVNAGSTLMVQIADGRLMTAGKPSALPRALLFDAQNNPIIAYQQDGALSLIAYTYDENVATEPGTVLSVYTLYDSTVLRECVNQFQQAYPDVMVDITVALPEGTAVTRDDAIRTLNTELLSGNGPDVLVLDGLPVENYIGQGMLLDLSSAVQPMLDSGALLPNIASSFAEEGSIPAVPTRFLLPTLWGGVSGMETLADMAAWAQANPDALPLYATDTSFLLGTFYVSCAPAWFDGQGRLDAAAVEEFLSALKEIRGNWTYEAAVQATGQDFRAQLSGSGVQLSGWNPYGGGLDRIAMEENMGAVMMMRGFQKQLPSLLSGMGNAAELNGQMIASNLENGGFAALPGQAEGCFLPAQILGVNRNSANAEVAQAFVAHALGEVPQSFDFASAGFPVNTAALEGLLSGDAGQGGMSMGGGGGGLTWVSTPLDEKQCAQLRSLIEGLTTPVVVDFTLYQMLVDESAPFFAGSIDAAQAAQNVCARANAYLAE